MATCAVRNVDRARAFGVFELASLIGGQMESGERRIDVSELSELARLYGKPLSYFVAKDA